MDFDDSLDVRTDTSDQITKPASHHDTYQRDEEKHNNITKDDELLITAKKNNELMYNQGTDITTPVTTKDGKIQQSLETQDSLYDNPMLYTQGIMPNGLNTLMSDIGNDVANAPMTNNSDGVPSTHISNDNDDLNNDYLFLGTQVQSRLDDYDKDHHRIRTFEEKINAFKNKVSEFSRVSGNTHETEKKIALTNTKSIGNITNSEAINNGMSRNFDGISEKDSKKTTKTTSKPNKGSRKKIDKAKTKSKPKKTPKTISEYNIVNHARTKNMMLSLLSGKKTKLKITNSKLTKNDLEKQTVLSAKADIKDLEFGSKGSFASSNDSVDTALDYPTYNKHEWEFVLSLLRENNINDTQNEKTVFYEIYGKDYNDTGFITKLSENETTGLPPKKTNKDHKENEINKTVLLSLSQMYGDHDRETEKKELRPELGQDTTYETQNSRELDTLLSKEKVVRDKSKKIPLEFDETTLSQVEPVIITSSPDHVTKFQATTPDAADTVIPNTTDEESFVNFSTQEKISLNSQSMEGNSQKYAHFAQNTQENPIFLDSIDSMHERSGDEHDEEFFYTPLSYNEKKNTNSAQKKHCLSQELADRVESSIVRKTRQDRMIKLTQTSFNAVPTLISPPKNEPLRSPSDSASSITDQKSGTNHKVFERKTPKVQVPATRANSLIITAHPSLDLAHSNNWKSFPPIAESLEIDYTNANTIIPESQEELLHYSPNKIIESPSLSSSKHKHHQKRNLLAGRSKSLTGSIDQNSADWEKLSPKDLSEALKRLGIPTSNLKRKKLSTKKNNMPAPLLSRSNSEYTAEYLATLTGTTPLNAGNIADLNETNKCEDETTTPNPKQNLLLQLSQLSYTTYDEFFEDLLEFVRKDELLLEIIYTYQVISFQWFLNYLLDKCSKKADSSPSPLKSHTALNAAEQTDVDLCSRLKIMLENIDSKLVKRWGDDQGICFGND